MATVGVKELIASRYPFIGLLGAVSLTTQRKQRTQRKTLRCVRCVVKETAPYTASIVALVHSV